MRKPDSLRAALTAALPELARDPGNLRIWIDEGRIVGRLADRIDVLKGYEYRYRINVLVMDFARAPNEAMLPLMLWLRFQQPDLLASHEAAEKAIAFEAEILDDQRVDLWFKIPLTETVLLTKQPGGAFAADHMEEPEIDPAFEAVPDMTLIDRIIGAGGGELLYQRPEPGPPFDFALAEASGILVLLEDI